MPCLTAHYPQKTLSFSLLGLLAILILLVGCTQTYQESVIRFGLASAPTNFDPRFATDATSSRINRLLYMSLIDFDKAAQPIPSLATWEQISPIHYRFSLRNPRQSFHHGPPLTAADVKATYEFILNPENLSPHHSSLAIISEIQTPTNDIVDFLLTRPDMLFPSYLVIGILPANLIHNHHPFHEKPIGSGPFAFIDQLDGTRWRLVRQVDGQLFEFLRIAKPTVRALKLLAGEIDMLQNDLPPELIPYLAKEKT
ncbi:MAG: ABC transporter substrate-binding protein, partial [Nitrospirales bacterium]